MIEETREFPDDQPESIHIPLEVLDGTPVQESMESLGGTAVANATPEEGSDLDTTQPDPQGNFSLYNTENLYRDHRRAATDLDYAKDAVEDEDDTVQSYGWLSQKLDRRRYESVKNRATQTHDMLAQAQQAYDSNLEEAHKHIDEMHEQANEVVSAYQQYAETQAALAEAIGAPVVQVRDINDFIVQYATMWGRDRRSAVAESGIYGALKDFFAPEMPPGTELNGRYIKYKERLPRPEIGVSAKDILEQESQDDAPLLKITNFYIPSVTSGSLVYQTIKALPEQQERYIKLTPELHEVFSKVAAEDLDFTTTLHREKDNDVYYPHVAEVGSRFELTDVKALKEAKAAQELPHKAVLTFQTDGAYNEKVWQSAEVGASTEQELRERVLACLLENVDLGTKIEIGGEPVNLKDFLTKNKTEPTE